MPEQVLLPTKTSDKNYAWTATGTCYSGQGCGIAAMGRSRSLYPNYTKGWGWERKPISALKYPTVKATVPDNHLSNSWMVAQAWEWRDLLAHFN